MFFAPFTVEFTRRRRPLRRMKPVEALVLQVREATAKDPKLATPQLHKATSDLILKVHGEP